MFEEQGTERYRCQHDIAYLAEHFIYYPLLGSVSLNDADRSALYDIQNGIGVIDLQGGYGNSHPMWRLTSMYLVHELLFGKSTTFFLIGQTKHLSRKVLETLYFPLNHLELTFLPEIEVKYTGCLKLTNNVCIRAIGAADNLPDWDTKEAVVISYGLLEIPTQLRAHKWIQVPEHTSN